MRGFLQIKKCFIVRKQSSPACYLVNLATVGVMTEVHGGLPHTSVGVHTQRTPTFLTLPPTDSLETTKSRSEEAGEERGGDSRLRVRERSALCRRP